MLETKLLNNNALAKKALINAGLQGITIAPKKKPYNNAVKRGLLVIGDLILLGNILERSTLKIKSRLITPKIPKAIGETIPITLVKDFCRIVVKSRPKTSIKIITPRVIISPSEAYALLVVFPENWFARNARKAG